MSVKIKGLKRLEKNVTSLLNVAISNPRLLEEVAEFTVNRIETETRKGKSMVTDSRLEPLSPSTKRRRARLGKLNQTHRSFRSGVSQLTFTGELLESITAKIFPRKRLIKFDFSGMHSRIIGLRGKPIGDRISNKDLAKRLQSGDPSTNLPPRPFMGLDEKATEQIKRIILKGLRNRLRR